MAYISILEDDEAPAELQAMYARMAPAGTPVDNILRIHSLNPRSLQVHHDLYRHLMYGPSDLSRAEREMIAVVVSRVNDCHYWLTHHGEGLRRLTRDDALADAVVRDHRDAGLAPKQVAMLDFVEGLSQVPPRSSRAVVDGLRGHGWSEAAILDMTQVAAYFAFVNRIADGLGVELEERWPEEVRTGGRSRADGPPTPEGRGGG